MHFYSQHIDDILERATVRPSVNQVQLDIGLERGTSGRGVGVLAHAQASREHLALPDTQTGQSV